MLSYATQEVADTATSVNDSIIGAETTLAPIIETIGKVAATSATVLIQGETGTGKELIANAIHYSSRRARRPFVRVNCAALAEAILESELFGHERGAFTGAERQRMGKIEQANGGTLFLDEVGDMSPGTQAKILRALQEQEFERVGGNSTIKVNVRVVAATNRDLHKLVEQGKFREDLLFRLNVVKINLPPLRERKEDLDALVKFFTDQFNEKHNRKIDGIRPEALQILRAYSWPGNVRELQNAIERAVLLADGKLIRSQDISLGQQAAPPSDEIKYVNIPPQGVPLAEIERIAITEALKMTCYQQNRAADLLRISPRMLNYKIRLHKIEKPAGMLPRWRFSEEE